jgi:hypothetical protein
MMRVSTSGKQLDEGTNKGQWRRVCEADCGAPDADSASYSALDLERAAGHVVMKVLRIVADCRALRIGGALA